MVRHGQSMAEGATVACSGEPSFPHTSDKNGTQVSLFYSENAESAGWPGLSGRIQICMLNVNN